ncbi:MAG: protein kinase [Myxococcales bacterium]|nr:protein kinase [Myxococcales bacterium]
MAYDHRTRSDVFLPQTSPLESERTVEGFARGALLDDRFELESVVGSGAAGVVFRAVDRRDGQQCAVKVLRSPQVEDVERFQREVQALTRLSHDAIVRLISRGTTAEGQPYLAMQWLDGESLAERLARGPLSEAETLSLAQRLAAALAASHAAGVLHRDVKPANVMLVGGATDRATLVDFGLVRLRQDPVRTRAGVPLGTPAYMAPEQVRGESDIDARADVFGLGATLYECLTGERAFMGAGIVDVLTAVMLDEPASLRERAPAVSPAFARLIERMLSKDREARPESGSAVATALDELTRAAVLATRAASASETHVFEHARAASVRGDRKLVWALFADTDRWDRYCRAPRTDYHARDDDRADGGVLRVGVAEIAAHPSRWIEVGEGIEGSRLRAARRFLDGRFAEIAFDVDVERDPEAPSRSRVRCVVRVVDDGRAPEGGAAMMLAFLADRLERYVDALAALLEGAPEAVLSGHGNESGSSHARRVLLALAWDDVALAGRATGVDADGMAVRLARWSDPIDGVGASLQSKLAQFAERGADDLVRRIRPAELAHAWNVDRAEMLRALLAGATLGLFELRWELRCRNCRTSAATAPSLDAITPSVHCAECAIDTTVDLSSNVEAVFSVAAAARKVSPKFYCGASATHRPHVAAFVSVDAGAASEIAIALPEGACVFRVPRRAKSARLAYAERPAIVRLRERSNELECVAEGAASEDGATRVLFENADDRPVELQVEYPADGAETTAVSVLALPEFARWFAGDAPVRGAELSLSRCAVLHIECAAQDELFARHGDAGACARLEAALRAIERALEASGVGAVFRRSIGAVGAMYLDGASAKAAFDRAHIEALREGVEIAGAVFEGACVAVRRDERLEIYGAGAHRAVTTARRSAPGACAIV